jgi:hypothetical protein
MDGWLGALAPDLAAAAQGRVRRWQYECERAGGDCAARVEAVALRLPVSRAVRSGPVLRLYTAAGPVEFVDGASSDHRYLGLLQPGLHHLLWRRGPEGVRFFTVAEDTGALATFDSLAAVPQVPRQAVEASAFTA